MQKKKQKKMKQNLTGYLFCGPFLILTAVFIIYPMCKGIYNSFFDFRFGEISFVGFRNYLNILSSPLYRRAIGNTLLMTFIVVPLLCVAGILIAGSVFDKHPVYVSFVRITLYLPVIASLVVMALIWRFMLDSQTGLLRYFYNLAGQQPVNLLGEAKTALILIIVFLFTVNIGQCVILYLATMIGIPRDLIEAMKIDGGNRWDLFRYILIPFSSGVTLLNFVTQTAAVIRVFVATQLLTNGGPNHKTTTMMYLLYEEGFKNGNFGPASALGIILFLFSILLVFAQFKAIKKQDI
ncbi:MAG: sugar ABC transporter permease [Eubacteriales bacterium]|nr:sugar ABC transporter permease [Eubacteriales bacterium]